VDLGDRARAARRRRARRPAGTVGGAAAGARFDGDGLDERDWYLGKHRAMLFDRNGNAGPTVWWDGRVVGRWAQREDGQIALRLLEDVGAEAVGAIESDVARLADWLGDVRFTPRFRTPLERELAT
jgi:winged helix DNA-binding protein